MVLVKSLTIISNQYLISSGRDAELLPIVNNGKVEQVLVTNGGFEYNSPPDLIVNGDGNYCKLTPVISGGQIIDVIVDEGGIGYTDTTTVTVKVGGQNASLIANINQWTVNLFEKYKDIEAVTMEYLMLLKTLTLVFNILTLRS